MTERTFHVEVVTGGTVLVREEAVVGSERYPGPQIIAAGSPKRCADTLKEIFEDMKKSA